MNQRPATIEVIGPMSNASDVILFHRFSVIFCLVHKALLFSPLYLGHVTGALDFLNHRLFNVDFGCLVIHSNKILVALSEKPTRRQRKLELK